jgi:hypothetical protein
MLANYQWLVNLLLLRVELPPQAYEFMRLFASSIYKKIPSWSERNYMNYL